MTEGINTSLQAIGESFLQAIKDASDGSNIDVAVYLNEFLQLINEELQTQGIESRIALLDQNLTNTFALLTANQQDVQVNLFDELPAYQRINPVWEFHFYHHKISSQAYNHVMQMADGTTIIPPMWSDSAIHQTVTSAGGGSGHLIGQPTVAPGESQVNEVPYSEG